jgi:imidazolonepropionase-like amidohydrolase
MITILVLLAGCGGEGPSGTPALALVHGQVITGTDQTPLLDGVVVIRGGEIVAVGRTGQVKLPSGTEVIDVSGATILPGFINAHVHDADNPDNLRAWAEGGVTSVRDEGASPGRFEALLETRTLVAGDPHYARLISAGRVISVEGGYGELFVSSPEDARQKVQDLLEAGADQIKITLEDGYAGASGLPKLTDAEIAAIVEAAHERGAKVSGHVTRAEYLAQMVAAGVDDIAHVPYDPVPEEAWGEMVSRKIALTPTFTVYRNFGAPVSICVENLRAFVQLGGIVALGSDYGGGPGTFELGIPMYEIEMMSQAGMTPMQIIVASTRQAAWVAGIEDQVGTLEPGKAADVLVVDGDPLTDLQALSHIRLVIHAGVIIRRAGATPEPDG